MRNTTITLTPGQPGLVRLSHSKLTFTRADWSQPQYVEITAGGIQDGRRCQSVPETLSLNPRRPLRAAKGWSCETWAHVSMLHTCPRE